MEHPQIMKPLHFALLVVALAFATDAHAQNTEPAYTPTPEMKLFPTPTPAAVRPKAQPFSNGNSLTTAQIQALQIQQVQQAQALQNQQTAAAQQQTGVLSPDVFQTLSPAVQQALKAAGQAPKSNGK